MTCVKYGDARTLRWQLNRDLTGASGVTVFISETASEDPLIERAGVIDDAATGIVSFTLDPNNDYGAGKLMPGMKAKVEVKVFPGPITHPECGFEPLNICWSLE